MSKKTWGGVCDQPCSFLGASVECMVAEGCLRAAMAQGKEHEFYAAIAAAREAADEAREPKRLTPKP